MMFYGRLETIELQEIISIELKNNGYYVRPYPLTSIAKGCQIIGVYDDENVYEAQVIAVLLLNNDQIEIDVSNNFPFSSNIIIINLSDPQSIPKLLTKIKTLRTARKAAEASKNP